MPARTVNNNNRRQRTGGIYNAGYAAGVAAGNANVNIREVNGDISDGKIRVTFDTPISSIPAYNGDAIDMTNNAGPVNGTGWTIQSTYVLAITVSTTLVVGTCKISPIFPDFNAIIFANGKTLPDAYGGGGVVA